MTGSTSLDRARGGRPAQPLRLSGLLLLLLALVLGVATSARQGPADAQAGFVSQLGTDVFFDSLLMPDGRVLLGVGTGGFETYDPATGQRADWGDTTPTGRHPETNNAYGSPMGIARDPVSGDVFAYQLTNRAEDGALVHSLRRYTADGTFLGVHAFGPPLPGDGQHSGGGIVVLDGQVYMSIGDVGGTDVDDPSSSLKGKLFRVPVATALTATPEIVAWGLRNPWKLSAHAGKLYVSDVGGSDVDADGVQTFTCSEIADPAWEEITVLVPGPEGTPPVDLGWRLGPPNPDGSRPEGDQSTDGDPSATLRYRHPCQGEDLPMRGYAVSGSTEHDGRLWFTDFVAGWIASMALDGTDVRLEDVPATDQVIGLESHPDAGLLRVHRNGVVAPVDDEAGQVVPGDASIELTDLLLDVLADTASATVTIDDPDGLATQRVAVELGHDDSPDGSGRHFHPIAEGETSVTWSLDMPGHTPGSTVWWSIVATAVDTDGSVTERRWRMEAIASELAVVDDQPPPPPTPAPLLQVRASMAGVRSGGPGWSNVPRIAVGDPVPLWGEVRLLEGGPVTAEDLTVASSDGRPLALDPSSDANDDGLLVVGESWTFTGTEPAPQLTADDPSTAPGCDDGRPTQELEVEATATTAGGSDTAQDATWWCNAQAPEPPAPERFAMSGLVGGGFVNVVAFDPRGNGVALAGGDVSGLHRSTDGGQTWRPVNVGLVSSRDLKAATIAFDPADPDVVYAGIGVRGDGALAVSQDNGRTWTKLGTAVPFSGANNNGAAGLPSSHPRSTGTLIDVATDGTLHVGTFDDGVWRSTDGGATWTTVALAGVPVRGLARDADVAGRLWIATHGQGLWRLDGDTATAVPGSPSVVEEVATAPGLVIVAAGGDGIWASTDGGASISRRLLGATDDSGAVWIAIVARDTPGGTIVWAAADNAPAGAGGDAHRPGLARSTDGGVTWDVLPTTTGTDPRVGGTGPEWWLVRDEPGIGLGERRWTPGQLAFDPADAAADAVVVAGRGGLWATADGGDLWYPVVEGLGVTINRAMADDPASGRFWVANTDWLLLGSDDDLATVTQADRPPGLLGTDIVVTDAGVHLAVGARDRNRGGDVVLSANPFSGDGWTSLGLGGVTGNRRPIGLAAGVDAGQPVLVAAVEESGIWRRVDDGPWQRVATGLLGDKATKAADLAWPPGSNALYLFDRSSGIWRSADRGVTWEQLWDLGTTPDLVGGLAVLPDDPTTLYAAVQNLGVVRITDAVDRAAPVTAGDVDLLVAHDRPGPMTAGADGALYATAHAIAGQDAALWRSVDGGVTWERRDDDLYRSAALAPAEIDVTGDGTTYVGLFGNGVIVGAGDGATPDTLAPTVALTAPDDGAVEPVGVVTISGTTSDDRPDPGTWLGVQDVGAGTWLRADGTFGTEARLRPVVDGVVGDTTSWSLDVDLPDGTYRIEAVAVDAAGNVAVTDVHQVVVSDATVDVDPPTLTLVSPTQGDTLDAPARPEGTATDDVGVVSVRLTVRDRVSGSWLRADGSTGAWQRHEATLTGPPTSVTWTLPIDVPAGEWGMRVEAVDGAGRVTAAPWTTFDVVDQAPPPLPDGSAPEVTIEQPAPNATVGSPATIGGVVAHDGSGVDGVTIALRHIDDGTWLQPDGTWGPFTRVPTNLVGHRFSIDVDAAPGAYGFNLEATDADGRTSSKVWTRFDVA